MKILRVIFLILFLSFITGCSTLHISSSQKITKKITFEKNKMNPKYKFLFPTVESDSILQELDINYPIKNLVKSAKTEKDKVLIVLNWVRNQWEHNGWNDAKTNNAYEILERAKNGEKFRCVEYGIVLKSALAVLGMKSRTLGLMTSDVETKEMGAGHVLAEVWLNDNQKWAMVDAQFNAMPILNDIPLNAVELQNAIHKDKPVKFVNLNGELLEQEHEEYKKFIAPYLYYFNISFDERPLDYYHMYKVNGKIALILVPLNAKNPTIFQQKYPINYAEYTNSLADFYRKPE